MNERIKALRLSLDLSMDKFGSTVGVSRSAISKLESGTSNLTEQMIISICREFSVSEEWLRYGTGEMFINLPLEDEFAKAAASISIENDIIVQQVLIEYWKLSPDSKKVFKNYILSVFKNLQKFDLIE